VYVLREDDVEDEAGDDTSSLAAALAPIFPFTFPGCLLTAVLKRGPTTSPPPLGRLGVPFTPNPPIPIPGP